MVAPELSRWLSFYESSMDIITTLIYDKLTVYGYVCGFLQGMSDWFNHSRHSSNNCAAESTSQVADRTPSNWIHLVKSARQVIGDTFKLFEYMTDIIRCCFIYSW